jgi:hypothetical protein
MLDRVLRGLRASSLEMAKVIRNEGEAEKRRGGSHVGVVPVALLCGDTAVRSARRWCAWAGAFLGVIKSGGDLRAWQKIWPPLPDALPPKAEREKTQNNRQFKSHPIVVGSVALPL